MHLEVLVKMPDTESMLSLWKYLLHCRNLSLLFVCHYCLGVSVIHSHICLECLQELFLGCQGLHLNNSNGYCVYAIIWVHANSSKELPTKLGLYVASIKQMIGLQALRNPLLQASKDR